MQTVVLNCSQVVPISSPAIQDGAILIEDGRIRAVGSRTEILKEAGEHTRVDAQQGVVTPALIDAHTHCVFAGNRANEFEMRSSGATYQQIAAAGGGIFASVSSTNAASDEALTTQSQRHLDWLIANGASTVEIKSGYGLSTDKELRMLRVARSLQGARVKTTLLAAHALPMGRPKLDYLQEIVEVMLPEAAKLGLIDYCDVFVENGFYSCEDAEFLSDAAHGLGLKMRLHVDQLSNGAGATLAARIGAKSADHLEHTDLEGVADLARTWEAGEGTYPILLPGSVHALGLKKYPPARDMLDAGLPVVLATDFNPGSSPVASLPFVMNLACTQMKMSPAEAMRAVTLNAAGSLDLGDQIGSLEPGKLAEFKIWSVSDWREIPYWIGARI